MPTPPRRSSNRSTVQNVFKDALSVSVEKEPTTLAYRVALTVVCGAMLLLPIIYLGLIALLLHTFWWSWVHGMHTDSPLSFVVCGFAIMTIISLVKPIFVEDEHLIPPSKLKRDAEPFLFEYVEAVCKAVNAPVPESIRIDCEVNASAGLSRGPVSLFSRELTLTIGLPLAAGLTVKEFTGVLAHEFGHFSQGVGMRASGLVRSINYWFIKAAYSRDRWDRYLAVTSEALPLRLGVFVYAVRVLIWLSRRFIAFLAIVSHGLSCSLLRQMEYDADRYEVRLVGSEVFAATSRKLLPLGLAYQMALDELETYYQEGRLADEFAKVVVSNVPRIDRETMKRVRVAEAERATGWFDSHPTGRDRVASAMAMDCVGALQLPGDYGDRLATSIFSDFSRVSKGATNRLYRRLLGEEFDGSNLCASDDLIRQSEREHEARKSLARYFRVEIPILRPLRLAKSVGSQPDDLTATVDVLKRERARVGQLGAEYETLADGLIAAEGSWLKAAAAHSLVISEVRFDHRQFDVRSPRKSDVVSRMRQTNEAVQNLALSMMTFEDSAELRLSSALRLLRHQSVLQRIPNGQELAEQTIELIPDSRVVSSLMSEIAEIRLANIKLLTLFTHLNQDEAQPELYHQIELQMRELQLSLKRIRKQLGNSAYPFDHGSDSMTISAHVLPLMPAEDDLRGLLAASHLAVDRLAEVQTRLFAKLTYAADQVERALKIAPTRSRAPQRRTRAIIDESD